MSKLQAQLLGSAPIDDETLVELTHSSPSLSAKLSATRQSSFDGGGEAVGVYEGFEELPRPTVRTRAHSVAVSMRAAASSGGCGSGTDGGSSDGAHADGGHSGFSADGGSSPTSPPRTRATSAPDRRDASRGGHARSAAAVAAAVASGLSPSVSLGAIPEDASPASTSTAAAKVATELSTPDMLSTSELEAIRAECFAEDVDIPEGMAAWDRSLVVRYFQSGGKSEEGEITTGASSSSSSLGVGGGAALCGSMRSEEEDDGFDSRSEQSVSERSERSESEERGMGHESEEEQELATRGVVAHALTERLNERMAAARELHRRLEQTLRQDDYGSEANWPSPDEAKPHVPGRRPSLNSARARLRYSTAGIAVGAYEGFDMKAGGGEDGGVSNGAGGRRRAHTMS